MRTSDLSKITPGADIVLLTPGASALAGGPCKGLWIGTEGNLNITTLAGEERDDVPALTGLFPIQYTHVRAGASETAAANIWAIY